MSNVWSIRSFLNTDTPSLAHIWSDHHSAYGSSSRCNSSLWDQCILSKAYFSPDHLLLAIDPHGEAHGLIHFGAALAEDGKYLSGDTGMIHRLCVRPHADEDRIAKLLLERACQHLSSEGLNRCLAVGALEASSFYLGIAEGDNRMGVSAADQRLQHWLIDGRFKPHTPTECWEVSLESFRPPMDRMQISIRRACTISRVLDEYQSNWWISTVLGHCDQVRFSLVSRGPDRTEMEVMLWYPDATIRGVDSATARLKLPSIPDDEENRERLIHLIAESLRQLQTERKRAVRVVASAQNPSCTRLLQRLNFRTTDHGMIYVRDLSEAVGDNMQGS
jgi:GNAT superfamily N-acetyltransferase